jgi:hypothetical protein
MRLAIPIAAAGLSLAAVAATAAESSNVVREPRLLNILTLAVQGAGFNCERALSGLKVGQDAYGTVVKVYCEHAEFRVTFTPGGLTPRVRPWR